MKKRKKRQNESFNVSSRKNPFLTVTHTLESSGINIKITAKQEDWEKFYKSYFFKSDKLMKDFLPIMGLGYYHSKPKTKHKKGQEKINAFKLFSALLYKFLLYLKNSSEYPTCFRKLREALINGYDVLDVTLNLLEYGLMPYFKKTSFSDCIWLEEFYNVTPTLSEDNLYITYIQGGLELIKKSSIDYLDKLLESSFISHWFITPIYESMKDKPYYDFLRIFSVAISHELTYPCCESKEDLEDYLRAINDSLPRRLKIDSNGNKELCFKNIMFIKMALKEIFPSLPIPDTYCKVSYQISS